MTMVTWAYIKNVFYTHYIKLCVSSYQKIFFLWWGIGIFFILFTTWKAMGIGQFFHNQLSSKYTYRLNWKYLFADFLQPDFASASSSPSCWGPELAPGWDWGWWWWWWWWLKLVYFKTRQNGQVFKRENLENITILYISMWDNYENSDISIISKGDNLENLDNLKRDNLVLLGSSSPACASAAEAGWWLPPHPAWAGRFFICVLYLPLLFFFIFAFYICRFLYLPHWAVRCYPPPSLSTSFQNIGHFLMSGAKKTGKWRFCGSNFLLKKQVIKDFPVGDLLFWKESKASKLSILTTF